MSIVKTGNMGTNQIVNLGISNLDWMKVSYNVEYKYI